MFGLIYLVLLALTTAKQYAKQCAKRLPMVAYTPYICIQGSLKLRCLCPAISRLQRAYCYALTAQCARIGLGNAQTSGKRQVLSGQRRASGVADFFGVQCMIGPRGGYIYLSTDLFRSARVQFGLEDLRASHLQLRFALFK